MKKIQLKTDADIVIHVPRDEWTNPCWMVYMHPYVFIVPDDEKPWKLEIDDINNVSYNSSNLLRVVTKIKHGLSDLDGLVCYDGAIALPMQGKFLKKESAIEYFNEIFLKLNLSGFFVGYVDHRDVLHGRLENKWCIYNYQMGSSTSSQLHSKNRWGQGSNMDSVHLDMPRILKVSEFHEILTRGAKSVMKIPNLSAKFLNVGITELRFRNWDVVLSNLWITAEQLVDHLWYNRFLKENTNHPNNDISGRKTSMKEDSRTWSAGIKQEMLFQAKIINEDIFKNLFEARRIRNKLVHEGKSVSEETAWNLFSAVSALLSESLLEDHKLMFEREIYEQSIFSGFYNPEDNLFEDWKSLPDENIIESILGPETTKNAKLP